MRKRLLSWLLILAMILPLFPTIEVNAGPGMLPYPNKSVTGGGDSWGCTGLGYIIGFGICDKEEYLGDPENSDDLETWILNYVNKYYVDIHGNYSYYPSIQKKAFPQAIPGGEYAECVVNDVAISILKDVATGTPGQYTAYKNDRIVIRPECLEEVVRGMYDMNPSLAAQWLNGRVSSDKHPVIIVAEAVAVVKDENGVEWGYTVMNFGEQLGVDISEVNLESAPSSLMYSYARDGKVPSRTAPYLWSLTSEELRTFGANDGDGRGPEDSTVAGKVFKALLGIRISTGTAGVYYNDNGSATGHYGAADSVTQGNNDEMSGSYTLSLNKGSPPTPDNKLLYGAYEWDINAEQIPRNSRGYLEDGTAIVGKGSHVTAGLQLGFIKLSETSKNAWINYNEYYGITNIELKFTVKSVMNKDYTTDRLTILSSGSGSTGVENEYTYTVTPSQMIQAFDDGFLPIQTSDFLEGLIDSPAVQGSVSVAYATSLKATVSSSKGTEDVDFTNNQVHYAIYTFEDEERTYKLQTVKSGTTFPVQGWAELKTMALGAPTSYEARKGTPTTDNMFISFGGNEYAVAMQYRYCIDDYIRTYQVKTKEPYPNYMYYEAGDSADGGGTSDDGGAVFDGGDRANTSPYPTGNLAWSYNPGLATDQASTFDADALAYKNKVEEIFRTIDENATKASKSVYSTEDYAVIVIADKLSLNSDWTIKGIADAVQGNDTSMKLATRTALQQLSTQLGTLYSNYNKGIREKHFPNTLNSTLTHDIEVVFMSLYDDKLDYDSDAFGQVKITFDFYSRNTTDATSPSKGYYKYERYGHTDSRVTDCHCGNQHGHTEHWISASPLCSTASGDKTLPKDGSCSGKCNGCTWDDKNGDGVLELVCDGIESKFHSSCSLPSPECKHYYQQGLDYTYTDGNIFDPSDVHGQIRRVLHGYHWYYDWTVNIDYEAGGNRIARKSDDGKPMSLGKDLSYDSTLTQVYKDVKYMDIIDCHVWRLGGGVADWAGGLASIMCSLNNNNPELLQIACSNQGYTLFNTDAVNCPGFWDDSFTTDFEEGEAISKGAWRAVPEEWAKTVDPLEEPVYGGNTELQAIGRLANSYHVGSADPKAPAGLSVNSRIGDATHGLLLEQCEDTVVMSYDIEEQGGRSHWSFPGFMKQALSLAFYKDEDPLNAYRNNIAVMSDYLGLGDAGNITMCGFHWTTKEWGKTGDNFTEAQDGLTCSIMSTQKSLNSSMLADYHSVNSKYWEKEPDLSKTDVNTTNGLNGIDIKGEAAMPGISAANDVPYTILGELQTFAEGEDPLGKQGTVRLERFETYKTYTVDFVNTSSTDTSYLTNFFSAVKEGLQSPAETVIPIVGYVGKQDSYENLHQTEISGGFSSNYNNSTGIQNLLDFGSGQVSNHLNVIPGSMGATSGGTHKIYNSGTTYPYFENLNVKRTIANNSYGGYDTALFYDKCLQLSKSYPGVQSLASKYMDGTKSSLKSYEPSVNNALSLNMAIDSIFGEVDEGYMGGAGFLQGVGYTGSSESGKTNNVVIYNPVSNISMRVLPSSELLPDARNTPVEEGYIPRDQRVEVYSRGISTDGGQALSVYDYREANLDNEPVTWKETVTQLKYPSDIATTAYTLDDYGLQELSKQCSILDSSTSYTVTSNGTYTLSIMGTGDKYTTVSLCLYTGDKVWTDGSSIYVTRFKQTVPYCTFDYLTDYVCTINKASDDATYAEDLATATKRAEDFVSSIDKDLRDIEAYLSTAPLSVTQGDSSTLDSFYNKFNSVVSTFKSTYNINSVALTSPYITEFNILSEFIGRLNAIIDKFNSINVWSNSESSSTVTKPFGYANIGVECLGYTIPNISDTCSCLNCATTGICSTTCTCTCKNTTATDSTTSTTETSTTTSTTCDCAQAAALLERSTETTAVNNLLSTTDSEGVTVTLEGLITAVETSLVDKIDITSVEEVTDCVSKLETLLTYVKSHALYDTTKQSLVCKYACNYNMLFEYVNRINEVIESINSYQIITTESTSPTLIGNYVDLKEFSITSEAVDLSTTDSTVRANTTLITDVTGCNTEAGDVISIELPLTVSYAGNPVEISISSSGVEGIDYIVTNLSTGNNIKYIIECLTDVTINEVFLKFNQDTNLSEFDGSCINFEDVWIADTGANWRDDAVLVNTTQHEYIGGGTQHKENSTRSRCANGVLFTSAIDWSYGAVEGFGNGKTAVVREVSNIYGLTQEALANPHKVYNANWRYYVVGWKTSTGAVIASPTDAALNLDTTTLCWPSGVGTITVAELKQKACLVMYQGKLYLTTREEGLKHHILETDNTVPYYDFWTLGSGLLEYKKLKPETEALYPLKHNTPAMFVDDTGKEVRPYQDYKYEFFFTLEDTDMFTPLFNVEYSSNYLYRFEDNATTKMLNGVDYDVTFDWETVEKEHTITTIVDGESVGNANYISLDDEFYIYCDNTGPFKGDSKRYDSNVGNNLGTLGWGWNTNGLRYFLDKGRRDKIDAFLSKAYTLRNGTDYTETSTWIESKVISFNKDVYVVKDNPTISVSSVDADDLMFVPAKQEIKLGYPFTCDCRTTVDGTEVCNHGGFHDYGEPGETCLRNADGLEIPYTYSFYLPLSAGESCDKTNNLEVTITTTAINGGIDGNKETNNTDKVEDPNKAVNKKYVNVVGRIGALTIADTGDPRYSDTFKVASEDYLLYPIVRKIVQYSNDYVVEGTQYNAAKGSQRGVVLDPFDVRGRIAQAWARDVLNDSTVKVFNKEGNLVLKDYSNYNTYSEESYNTYTTQWFKSNLQDASNFTEEDQQDKEGVQYGGILPLNSGFNKHKTFKTQPLKVGYELYLSLESIGYYFSSGVTNSSLSNGNNDRGNRQIQIRPFYSALDAKDSKGNTYKGAVDVYMRDGDNYVLINWGCDKLDDKNTEVCDDSTHTFNNLFTVVQNNAFPYYVQTNTNKSIKDPDEELQRRMVTDAEANTTYEVIDNTHLELDGEVLDLAEKSKILRSILTRWDNSTKDEDGNDTLGGLELDTRYSYGNSQILFLRDRNMTYVGGPSVALDYDTDSFNQRPLDTKRNAQKYYFGLGLPSSAVFVPHGEKLTEETVLVSGYVLSSIDVIAIGDIWNLHYMSDVSKMTWSVAGNNWDWTEWNPWYKTYPWLVPVTYYDIEQTSLDDVDTEGSH